MAAESASTRNTEEKKKAVAELQRLLAAEYDQVFPRWLHIINDFGATNFLLIDVRPR